jgi:hypothetical protein
MKQHATEPQTDAPVRERWTALEPGASDEALAGSLLRSAAAVRPFGAKEMAEVSARLRSREHFRPRPLAFQLAVALALILFGSALSAGVSHVLHKSAAPTAQPAPLATAPEGSRTTIPRPHRRPISSPSPAAPALPEPKQALTIPPPALEAEAAPVPSVDRPRPVRRVAMRELKLTKQATDPPAPAQLNPAPAPLPQPGVSALAKESRLLARAIAELRQDGNAKQSLATLDQHDREFGSGSPLSPEANAARIEAMLRLGRHTQALALLDAMALATTGPQREMLVARAELRFDQGRRGAALLDFDRLLTGAVKPDAVTERARFGRATCRAQLGDVQGAQSDLAAYLASFPEGRFAARARQELDRNDR